MKRLVIVESPTKARTIIKFLPDNYVVEASMGHVRDLPSSAAEIPEKYKKAAWSRLGVDVENEFEPLYVIPSNKKKVVKGLKSALKDAEALFIATDEDREGESIGWHLIKVLKPTVPIHRMVFHEITESSIQAALENTREINKNLVEAQETRRILDRLVGYSISPLLWKKIAPKLSAGRVQSVAVRILVLREAERIRFVPASYWSVSAELSTNDKQFQAVMTHVGNLRLATGRDFDDNTGKLNEGLKDGKDCIVLQEDRANALVALLKGDEWKVIDVEERTVKRSPSAPFITSTLQQEASRKLRLSARDTMRTAQRLYEQGFITYMRTDSTSLSSEAIGASRNAIESRYGSEYLSASPRTFTSKVRNAQEAHEAIRPSGSQMRTVDDLGLFGDEGNLYELIWKRTVASQMADARVKLVTAKMGVGDGDDQAVFRANGRTVEFPGFFRAYIEGSDDPEAALEDKEQPLPELKVGDSPSVEDLEAKGHETKPPVRFTDASLIKVLESEGIGRPSTYASIIDTIVQRGYTQRKGNQLIPTFTAFATNNLLEQQFQRLVDLGFTAEMEQDLDDIASGSLEPVPYLRKFFNGKNGLEARIEEGLDKIDAKAVSTIQVESWNPYTVRVGKYGPYVEIEIEGERVVASIPESIAPGDVSTELLKELISDKQKEDVVLGIHPDAEMPILLKKGPFGYYIQLGDNVEEGKPKRISVPKTMDPEAVDHATAVKLLELPRRIGNHPESGKEILVNIGRYGPYVQHESTFASLTVEDDVLTVELDRALELIATKESRNKPLRTLGEHPESGEQVNIFDGRYGPYVKHKRTNASIPKNTVPETVTMDQALELLAKKEARKGKGGRKKKS
ncbi:MAG: type I DNA topoisomerase [Bacteroidetes bacterium]|nr:type I DNA topoisomerase [Bacteroidota bacterium]